MATARPVQTFGIELELVCVRPTTLVYPPLPADSDEPDRNWLLDAVYAALLAHGIPVSDHNSLDISDSTAPFSQWRVEEEVLALTPEEQANLPEGYIVEGIELASRKFSHSHDDWCGEIAALLTALHEMEVSTGVKFLVNKSTGFHVHVGYTDPVTGQSVKVPLRTAKNIFLFSTAYEHLIDTLHAVLRIDVPWETLQKKRHHCFPLSFFATVKPHRNAEEDNLFARLQFIENLQSYAQIGEAFTIPAVQLGGDEDVTGHNAAVNFDNLFPCPESGRYEEMLTGTVEFRQHAGTMDLEAIVAWVELTCGLLRYCDEAARDVNGMGDFLSMLVSATDPSVSWSNFLTPGLVAVPEEVKDYYDAIISGTLHLPLAKPQILHPAHLPLDGLLNTNTTLLRSSFCRAAVESVIHEKFATDMYGFNPSLRGKDFVVPVGMAEKMLAYSLGEAAWLGLREVGGEEMIQAFAGVFGDLSGVVVEEGIGADDAIPH